ncbi:hypothetical protein [Nostoc sp.]|uniref:hypothetical protein n=1 Tax=Nostoc sp. TaxID=1180 RepID=UPI002FFA70FC
MIDFPFRSYLLGAFLENFFHDWQRRERFWSISKVSLNVILVVIKQDFCLNNLTF